MRNDRVLRCSFIGLFSMLLLYSVMGSSVPPYKLPVHAGSSTKPNNSPAPSPLVAPSIQQNDLPAVSFCTDLLSAPLSLTAEVMVLNVAKGACPTSSFLLLEGSISRHSIVLKVKPKSVFSLIPK